jgi:guanylate kinase
MTYEELQKLKDDGKIAYDFDVFGGTYAYKKDEILSNENYVFEMYYTTIQDWKRIRPDIVTIYILPNDINVALEQVKKRNLTPEKENERIKETEEQYKNFIKNCTTSPKSVNNYSDFKRINETVAKINGVGSRQFSNRVVPVGIH